MSSVRRFVTRRFVNERRRARPFNFARPYLGEKSTRIRETNAARPPLSRAARVRAARRVCSLVMTRIHAYDYDTWRMYAMYRLHERVGIYLDKEAESVRRAAVSIA